MATNSSLKYHLKAKKEQTSGKAPDNTLRGILSSEAIAGKFEELLKDKAPEFINSILAMVDSDASLKSCEPLSIAASCMAAAALNLPIDKSLGYAWLAPSNERAALQLGHKGYLQLLFRKDPIEVKVNRGKQ